jgi:hypothetical protein
MKAKHFRTLFLSDVHLGTAGCQADMLIGFLREHDAEKSIWLATLSMAGA